MYLGEPSAVGDIPGKSEEDVPLPDVSYPGDRDGKTSGTRRWSAVIICNPVYAGIPPFPAIVDDKTWIAAGVKMVENVGLRQYLVNVSVRVEAVGVGRFALRINRAAGITAWVKPDRRCVGVQAGRNKKTRPRRSSRSRAGK